MTVFGIDYAWSRPPIQAMKDAGVRFVCRYLSTDTTGKNLNPSEALALTSAGIWIVSVWETTARRPLEGHTAGAADARRAAQQAAGLGMPSDRPVYFAVDFDVQDADKPAVLAYMDGCASTLGWGRVGVYGGLRAVQWVMDTRKRCRYAWQTYAWSGGRWDPRALIQQYSNGEKLDGHDVDYNRAMVADPDWQDFGQWMVGANPTRLTPPQMHDHIRFLLKAQGAMPGTNPGANPYWQV